MTLTCTTTACSERGVTKPLYATLDPGEPVICGQCGRPCLVDHDPDTPAPGGTRQPPEGETMTTRNPDQDPAGKATTDDPEVTTTAPAGVDTTVTSTPPSSPPVRPDDTGAGEDTDGDGDEDDDDE